VRAKLAFFAAVAAVVAVALAASSHCSPSLAKRAPIFVDFQGGLEEDFNLDGVGEVIPKVVGIGPGMANDVARFELRGRQNRSELILGPATMGDDGTVRFYEGAEYWYGFSFDIVRMVYGRPGAHNLIMQFKSNGYGSPLFGLQLWSVYGRRGLWSAGTAMEKGRAGERFLAPLSEQRWHHVRIWFRASEHGAGFYRVYLDGRLVDRKNHVTMIDRKREFAYIKSGLYRNGDQIPGRSVLLLDSAELGEGRPPAPRR
jgi:hypothetical protein